AARGDQSAWPVVVIILRLPHLMLADVGNDDGFAACFLPKIVDDMGSVKMAVVGKSLNVSDGGVALELAEVGDPVGAFEMFDVREQLFENLAGVADQGGVDLHVLIDLGAIDLAMDLLGVACVGAEIAGDAIVETHANGYEEVGFLN